MAEGDKAEKEIEKYVLQKYSWENLPVDIKRMMSTKENWEQAVIRYR